MAFQFCAISRTPYFPQAFDNSVPDDQDINQGRAFVDALGGGVFDFRAIHDRDRSLQGVNFRGTIDDVWSTLVVYNQLGYGCFVVINQMDGHGRSADNITNNRAQFVDLDNLSAMQNLQRANEWVIKPSFMVQSSANKAHVYWPVIPYQGNDRFHTIQRKLIQLFDGDPACWDAPRVMRLPGTYHLKGEPQLVTCQQLSGYGMVTPVDALELALAHVNVVSSVGERHELGDPGKAAPSLEWVQYALDNCDPNTLDRGDWVSFTAAIKQSGWSLTDPDTLYGMWSAWCERYSGNDVGENLKQWNSIKDAQVGWSSIVRRVPSVQAQLSFGGVMQRQRNQRKTDDIKIGDDLAFSTVPTVLTLEQMQQHLVFVATGSKVVNTLNKTTRTVHDAGNEYAASWHTFDTGKIDKDGQPILKTIPALQSWMKSETRTSVDTITWNPADGQFCRSPEISQGGDKAYNLWSGIRLQTPPENWQEWAQPFLKHVEYLVPDHIERERFLKWCAHIFQKPGELPHTCYLMITPQTGTGRGTLGSILTRALRGYVAANMDVNALFGGFNGRLAQKLLVTVDEIREGNAANRYQNQEAFKAKITEETRNINEKYGMQFVEKNCCRFLMFSNHEDALPFDNSDRRVIVVENPVLRQSQEYYLWLNKLLKDQRFIASVQRYLTTLSLDGFSPHEPAPMNVAKVKSLKSMESPADQDAQEFIRSWPGELATTSDLTTFMGENAPRSPAAMGHAIKRAGMKSAHKQKIGPDVRTVLIVKGDLTAENLVNADRSEIARTIIGNQMSFRKIT
ncbi:DUF5906 domain-containing protein [Pseudosulfitobacter koreensis]|uniref:DUF5906 domain-containing protein n=1 Tax=Pseudosulfitobacter koreensis TaxID=2968472 RepID=A0ABT1Z393_9RHOB|nr:DUF5906 domain-containing protein [Pseudosulfitobacter koreense]MCR8827619.1 DUF5906 domain-containing protein [Pseudosulfitobacter koreense]